MKKLLKHDVLPAWMLFLGGVAIILREILYLTAMDEKHLMAAGHPLELGILALTGLVLLAAAAAAVPAKGTREYSANFPADPVAATGNFLMALGVLLTVALWDPAMGGLMGLLWLWLGVAAGIGLGWAGVCRFRGKKPSFGTHLALCLFLAVHMMSHYQAWSKIGCLMDYFFPLLGGVSLLLLAYHHTAFDVDLGQRRMLLGVGLSAMFLCTAALSSCGYWLLYGCGILWAGTNLCRWQVPPEPVKEERQAEET